MVYKWFEIREKKHTFYYTSMKRSLALKLKIVFRYHRFVYRCVYCSCHCHLCKPICLSFLLILYVQEFISRFSLVENLLDLLGIRVNQLLRLVKYVVRVLINDCSCNWLVVIPIDFRFNLATLLIEEMVNQLMLFKFCKTLLNICAFMILEAIVTYVLKLIVLKIMFISYILNVFFLQIQQDQEIN